MSKLSRSSLLLEPGPLPIFFVGTFVIAWTVWLLAAWRNDGVNQSLGVAGLLDLAGAFAPSLAAIVLIAASKGRRGLRQVARQFRLWRVGGGWYAFVLGAPPVMTLTAIGVGQVLGLAAPDFANPPIRELARTVGAPLWTLVAPLVLQQLVMGSAMGEELGWRGYALPRLQATRDALQASLLLGAIWGVWHLPRLWTQYEGPDGFSFGWFVLASVLGTVATAILFTWVYNSTRGSLLLVARPVVPCGV